MHKTKSKRGFIFVQKFFPHQRGVNNTDNQETNSASQSTRKTLLQLQTPQPSRRLLNPGLETSIIIILGVRKIWCLTTTESGRKRRRLRPAWKRAASMSESTGVKAAEAPMEMSFPETKKMPVHRTATPDANGGTSRNAMKWRSRVWITMILAGIVVMALLPATQAGETLETITIKIRVLWKNI